MKIKFTNGKTVTPIVVTGANRAVKGARRDTLTFVFPASEDINELDEIFSEGACETLQLEEDNGNINIFKGYTVRVELLERDVVVSPKTENQEAKTEKRIFVSMAQRTPLENQIASLTETVDILVLENLLGN